LEALGQMIARSCELARYLERRVAQSNELELLAPVSLNIVCFRYKCPDADRINARIVVDLQESGIAAPSTTRINGELAIRAAIANHRTSSTDIDALVDATLAIGRALTASVEDPEMEAAYRD
jgi:aromatic-L-amino-acid/L-tryptophan decarboxylase